MGETEQKQRAFDTGTLIMWALFAICAAVFALTCGDKLLGLPKLLYVFLRMASIVGLIGIPAYFIGEAIPKSIYDPYRFPFKPWAWEQNGRIYEKLGIKRVKARSIDMSKFMKRSFPKQNITRDPARLTRLVQEMCNAEAVHWVLLFLSPVFALLIEGWYGTVIAMGYALSNLNDVVIQRYNRPRILMILERLKQ